MCYLQLQLQHHRYCVTICMEKSEDYTQQYYCINMVINSAMGIGNSHRPRCQHHQHIVGRSMHLECHANDKLAKRCCKIHDKQTSGSRNHGGRKLQLVSSNQTSKIPIHITKEFQPIIYNYMARFTILWLTFVFHIII